MVITATDVDRVLPARPTVAVRGADRPELAGGLLAMRVHERVEGPCRCELTVGNWGARNGSPNYLYFDRRLLDFGVRITVAVADRPVFDGRVSALEAEFPAGRAPRLTVLAEDGLEALRTRRRSRTFTDVTDADVVQRLAAEHGLTADVDLPGPRHPLLAQLNQSDLAFLRDRIRALEAELWSDGGVLRVQPRSVRYEAAAPLRLGRGRELREVTVIADLAGQRTDVTVAGWDVSSKREVAVRAGAETLGAELRGGAGGAEVLAAGLGERHERIVQTVPVTAEEARARAESLYRRLSRRFVVARGTADPTPGLRVGARVQLAGLGELFEGAYDVTEVVHVFDDIEGLRTEFVAERAGLGRPGGGGAP